MATLSKDAPWAWTASKTENPALAADLICLVPVWEDDTTPDDQINATFTSPSLVGTPDTDDDATVGWNVSFNGTNEGLEWDTGDSPFNGLTAITLVIVFRIAVADGTKTFIRKDGTLNFQAVAPNWQLALWPGGTIDITTFGTLTTDKWMCAVITWASADEDFDWWVYNIEDETSESGTAGAVPTGGLANNATKAYRWGITEGGLEDLNGDIAMFALSNVKVSDADAASLSQDPYQLVNLGTFPAAPNNLTATAVSTSQINLSWDAVSGAGGYDVERDGSVISADQAGTTYNDTGLNTGQSYDYRVRAVS